MLPRNIVRVALRDVTMNGIGNLTILLMASQDVQVKIPTPCMDEIVNRGDSSEPWSRVAGQRMEESVVYRTR
jgi:hypothetical protein